MLAKGKDLNKIVLLQKLLRKLSDFRLSDIKTNGPIITIIALSFYESSYIMMYIAEFYTIFSCSIFSSVFHDNSKISDNYNYLR